MIKNKNIISNIVTIVLTLMIIIGIFCLLFVPSIVNAKSYNTMNFEESLKDENITLSYEDYKENDQQVTIYLFRGKGCSVCKSFLTFLNSIASEYGKYFKVVSFEVWNDTENKNLLNEVANFTGVANKGVPYIVIGSQVFDGYYSGYDEDIKEAIKNEYAKDTKYDVLKEMNKDVTDGSSNNSSSSNVWWSLLFTVVSTGIIMYYVHYENKKILTSVEKISKKK